MALELNHRKFMEMNYILLRLSERLSLKMADPRLDNLLDTGGHFPFRKVLLQDWIITLPPFFVFNISPYERQSGGTRQPGTSLRTIMSSLPGTGSTTVARGLKSSRKAHAKAYAKHRPYRMWLIKVKGYCQLRNTFLRDVATRGILWGPFASPLHARARGLQQLGISRWVFSGEKKN